MLYVMRSLLVIALYSSLSVLAFGQSKRDFVQVPEVIYGATSVEWPASVPDAGLLLTISGPAGFYLRQENPAGTWGRFSLVNEQGQPRADGVYKWELVSQAGWEPSDEASQVQSGWFEVQSGRVVADGIGEGQSVTVEERAPANSLYVDSQGRVGVGTSVPGAQLHLKGTNAALAIEDTQAGGREYRLRSLEKGDGSLGLFDQATGEARWLVDGKGRMGINTTKPTSILTVDGYIESSKGFLVDGKPVRGFGVFGGSQPLNYESDDNNYFGTGAGAGAGTGNSFFGAYAGDNATGNRNSFFGFHAGRLTTDGAENSFFGWNVGFTNSSGTQNSFFGANAGNYNVTGSRNSFFGYQAGFQNTDGSNNSFFGHEAGYANVGNYNAFFGDRAGHLNTSGAFNCFFGVQAGEVNTIGERNSFFGGTAGARNTTGSHNSFFGRQAGIQNTSGSSNSAFGAYAGENITIECCNTLVGHYAELDPGTPGSVNNATAIGANAYVAQANSLVLGSINGVNGATSYVNVGIGTTTPARQLHLAGPNAVFRMDRSTDTASFILVRTDATGATPWKSFVVGTNATGVNQGEFIINDIGTAVGGGGNRRMTITNEGNVEFTGIVTAAGYASSSSIAFKTNVRTLENAIDMVNRLRGVRFDWKESGEPAVGLIAEEVDEVVPEVVAHEGGAAKGVNYANLVAVLVEAIKAQEKTIQEQREGLRSLKAELEAIKALLNQNKR